MARSHHRKKHKEHVRQYRNTKDELVTEPKGKTFAVFTVIGVLTGMAIGYFATESSLLWMGVGAVAVGIIGYYIGRKIDGDA
ncbi:MAG TPA: hypothetical protein PK977_12995 [Chitinophagaceae bacterium]|nr:hypothetical protein [Chitinophagaceae bacterium]HRF19082.1 hypothetical protein [Chitinophagaceae bacterium]